MRKLLVCAVLALGCVPATAVAQTPEGDSVTGSGRECVVTPCGFFDNIFSVDAHSGPEGEAPTGTAEWASGFGRGRIFVSGEVVCLAVSGNVGVVGIAGTLQNFLVGTLPVSAVIRVTDGGGEASSLDSFAPSVRFPTFGPPPQLPPPPDCSSAPTGGGFVNELGDLVVRDVRLPSSKEQCKSGGWQDYGSTFKNQGECVAFVNRGPGS